MNIRTLYWDKGKLKILDQQLLPSRTTYISCETVESAREAIKELKVRGAPAIGIAAAYAMVIGAQNSAAETSEGLIGDLRDTAEHLKTARPTAVNLSWAADRLMEKALGNREKPVRAIKELLLEEAHRIAEEDAETCRKISEAGARLLKDADTVLTHCNAGALATGGTGTALGVIYAAARQKRIRVFACETRPLLQGARLTSWELLENGIDTTLICDNTAGWVMKQGMVSAVIVGADRVAPNADAANKIGSYSLAVLAGYHRLPFYVCAPLSSFDFSIKSGGEIPIEERSEEEIKRFAGIQTAPAHVRAYSPAFDIIPAGLITALVTEEGVIFPPFKENIEKIRQGRGH